MDYFIYVNSNTGRVLGILESEGYDRVRCMNEFIKGGGLGAPYLEVYRGSEYNMINRAELYELSPSFARGELYRVLECVDEFSKTEGAK